MNSSVFKEKVRKDHQRLHQDLPPSMRNGPKLYPYISTRASVHESSVPWIVEQPSTASGDNSLTALQIAKSLSEVDFQTVDRKYQFNQMPSQQRHHGYNYGLDSERNYSWEKEVSVLHGAPETVWELLSTLGLQRYTLDLSRNGWDDLDYFSGITEEELCAAGVSNPSHRRRILENLPKIWDWTEKKLRLYEKFNICILYTYIFLTLLLSVNDRMVPPLCDTHPGLINLWWANPGRGCLVISGRNTQWGWAHNWRCVTLVAPWDLCQISPHTRWHPHSIVVL